MDHAHLQRDVLLLDFLGYGTHGNFVVMEGPTWEGYYEFPPR